MGLNTLLRKKPETLLNDISEDRLLQLQKSMFQNQILLCEDGVDADELPNAQGEFGLSLSNPIPCQSILGQRMYLDRLRTADGGKVMYQRIGSFFSDITKHPIDGYVLTDTNGTTLETIYISAYQKRISGKCPKNFYLANNSFS